MCISVSSHGGRTCEQMHADTCQHSTRMAVAWRSAPHTLKAVFVGGTLRTCITGVNSSLLPAPTMAISSPRSLRSSTDWMPGPPLWMSVVCRPLAAPAPLGPACAHTRTTRCINHTVRARIVIPGCARGSATSCSPCMVHGRTQAVHSVPFYCAP